MAVCKSCQAPIIWTVTTNDKAMPVDAEPVDEGNVELHWPGDAVTPIRATVHAQRPLGLANVPLHLSHFATCPNTATDPRRRTAMELVTLISPEEAAEQLQAYEAQLTGERTAEDDAIRAGYRAAARGLPVIHLPTVIAAGGWFPNGLPRIAVVRADATECYVWARGGGPNPWELTFCDRPDDRGRARVGAYRVQVSVPGPDHWTNRKWHAHTIVPVIPPQHRPRRRRLHLFHVLWEVERWDPTPPVDPALLRHIRGDLWAVQATWDLTELERAVLAARAGA